MLSGPGEGIPILFSVVDTGIGIPPDRQHHIFDPFAQADSSTTRKFGGTGLGLTICSRLVTLMGGHITVASEVGKGSTFSFSIHVKRDDSNVNTQPDLDALKQVPILVVDDNETQRRILGDELNRWQMQPLLAENSDDALTMLQQRMTSDNPVRIVLIDYSLPGISGINLVEQVKSQFDSRTEIVVMLRSIEQRDGVAYCNSLGVANYLIKPLRHAELRDTLLTVLNATTEKLDHKTDVPTSNISLNILLAEDNQVNQLVMQRLLTKRGHQVTIAANGRLACEALKNQAFDLVFMDVQMPEMDGFEATAAIRKEHQTDSVRVPIIALTAHAMTGDQERCLAAGMDGYMSKPINPSELDAVLLKYGIRSSQQKEALSSDNILKASSS